MQIHSIKKACVAVYPSTVQNGIVWFWPNTDPQYRDILTEKKPPYIPEMDDPSYTSSLGTRDLAYGYNRATLEIKKSLLYIIYIYIYCVYFNGNESFNDTQVWSLDWKSDGSCSRSLCTLWVTAVTSAKEIRNCLCSLLYSNLCLFIMASFCLLKVDFFCSLWLHWKGR